jgi:hypothetical protein|tara:strand:+ start:20414 stop:20599 length:186 start_codon:yes stop_codon:yes gene_type:complete
MYNLQTCADARFEDAGDRLASAFDDRLVLQEGDERVMRVACDEETIVALEVLLKGRKAVRN